MGCGSVGMSRGSSTGGGKTIEVKSRMRPYLTGKLRVRVADWGNSRPSPKIFSHEVG